MRQLGAQSSATQFTAISYSGGGPRVEFRAEHLWENSGHLQTRFKSRVGQNKSEPQKSAVITFGSDWRCIRD